MKNTLRFSQGIFQNSLLFSKWKYHEEERQENMFCIHCGNELPPNARFCSSCGKSVQVNPPQKATNNSTNVLEQRKPNEKPKTHAKNTKKKENGGCLVSLIGLLGLLFIWLAVFQMLFGEKNITGKSYVEVDSKSERLSTISSDLRNHPLLSMRGVGTCEYLRDDVAVEFVFVDDDESCWSSDEIRVFMAEINDDVDWFNQEAVRNRVPLNMAAGYRRSIVSGVITPDNAADFYDSIITAAGLPTNQNLDMVAVELEEVLDAQEVPLVFVFNKEGRSWAQQKRTTEFAAIFQDADAFRHELCHLFAARDFYYPEEVSAAADLYLGDSIMNGGTEIDALTAYLMGWSEGVSSDVISFLNATKHITQEMIEQAHAEEVFTGYGTKKFDDGSVYTGNLVRGWAQGFGTRVYENGSSYSGDHVDNVAEGQGMFIWYDGRTYQGEFSRGLPNGWGILTGPDGTVYEGEFVDNTRTGNGTITWADGTVYKGEFYFNELHGYGVITYPDGSQRAGMWNNGDFVG